MLKSGSWSSRSLAILLSGVVLTISHQLLIEPLLSTFEETKRTIEQSRDLLQQYRTLATQRSFLAEQLSKQQKRAAASDSAYIQGPSDALAAARLSDLVRSTIETAGGEVSSVEVLSTEPAIEIPGIRRISILVNAVMTIDSIARFSYVLEKGEPYVFIKELIVRIDERSDAIRPSVNPMLYVTLRICSYTRERLAQE